MIRALSLSGMILAGAVSCGLANAEAKSRHFVFRYHVTITDLPAKKTVRVWVPLATSNRHQSVKISKIDVPGKFRKTVEKRFGNAMLYFTARGDAQSCIPIRIDYEVIRKEIPLNDGETVTRLQRELFLKANRLVPTVGQPLNVLLGKIAGNDATAIGRSIYDRVDQHVRYDKLPGGKWGRGDSLWVCDSRYGNCSDFHSLFISLCRSRKIPARFRIGFPIGENPKGNIAGYHCWAEFANGKRWSPVDISEADKNPKLQDYYFGRLLPNRILFTTGRDLTLSPKQQSGPVNFFIYPHVEVGGKLHATMERRFVYELRNK